MPEDGIGCDSFTVISIDLLLVYENKYYLQVYLNNCAYKIANKQMTDYLKFWITIELIQGKELILLKVTFVKNVWFDSNGFVIMNLNVKILCAVVTMTWHC